CAIQAGSAELPELSNFLAGVIVTTRAGEDPRGSKFVVQGELVGVRPQANGVHLLRRGPTWPARPAQRTSPRWNSHPFAFSELLARVRSVLRRGPGRQAEVVRVADLEIALLGYKAHKGAYLTNWPMPHHSASKWTGALGCALLL